MGIDVGTTFTAAATLRMDEEASTESPIALPLGQRRDAVPSVLFYDDDLQLVVGEAAERRALVCADRVVREFKRRVGDGVPILVGESGIAAEDAFAALVVWVVARATEREGAPPFAITLSHPAGWGQYKRQLVRESLARAGLPDIGLITEPEAAAVHYAMQGQLVPGSTIAVYDLGGGTFDVAILRRTEDGGFEPIGRPEGIEHLGGIDFDDLVFRHTIASLGDSFASIDLADPGTLMAVSRMRRECVEAKEALSFDSETAIPVLLPELQTEVRLVRSELERMIAPAVQETIAVLRHAIQRGGLEPDDLTAILLTGGSSRVPLVTQLLSEQLGCAIAIDTDPKATIALGAAIATAASAQEALASMEAAAAITAEPGEAAEGLVERRPRGRIPAVFAAAPADAAVLLHSRVGLRAGVVAVAVGAIMYVVGAASPVVLHDIAAQGSVQEKSGEGVSSGAEEVVRDSSTVNEPPAPPLAPDGAAPPEMPWRVPASPSPSNNAPAPAVELQRPSGSSEGPIRGASPAPVAPAAPQAGSLSEDPPAPVDTQQAAPVPESPAPEEPAPVDPVPEDPAPVDPVPDDPAPVDPVPDDPAPMDPAPVESEPSDPAPVVQSTLEAPAESSSDTSMPDEQQAATEE
ncbi:Hsp70 family protein [Compostimonas suwonensis]|uniref:Hsp70 family protein n=1 Tax=Compostimonas suwonensis TaxID=1048394 RepID=UPI001474079D|nr:Hsp70 family protein [Compostimonas suwonensis]